MLNVQNGMLDLRSGALRLHRRDDLIAKLAPVTFDSIAESTVLVRFLVRVLPDQELRAFVQRAVGYSLVGVPLEDGLPSRSRGSAPLGVDP